MAIELVTGLKNAPHITSDEVGAMQQGIFGVDDYVLSVGKKMAATLVTNNSIRIDDGEAVMRGRHFRIKPGTYENVTIDNGSQGMKRKDYIVARYTKDSQGIEKVELAVLKGNPTSGTIAVSKIPTKGDIRAGTLKHEMGLYVVELDGLNVVNVFKMFTNLQTGYELQERVDEANTEIQNMQKYGPEVVVGKTEENELIYRRTLSHEMTYFNKPPSGYNDCTISLASTVSKLIKIEAVCIGPSEIYTLPYSANGSLLGLWIKNVTKAGVVHLMNNVEWGSDYTMQITAEYVK